MMQLCTVNAEINDCMHFFHLFIFSKAQCAYLTSSIIGDKKWSGHNYYVTKVTSVSSWLDAFPLLLLFFFFFFFFFLSAGQTKKRSIYIYFRAQELCESQGGCPRLPSRGRGRGIAQCLEHRTRD